MTLETHGLKHLEYKTDIPKEQTEKKKVT